MIFKSTISVEQFNGGITIHCVDGGVNENKHKSFVPNDEEINALGRELWRLALHVMEQANTDQCSFAIECSTFDD